MRNCNRMESEFLRKEKSLLSWQEPTDMLEGQSTPLSFGITCSWFGDTATQVATARPYNSMQLCEDSYCLMLPQWLKKVNHHLRHCYCLLTGLESHHWRQWRAEPKQLCIVRLMWWHLVYDHTSHISSSHNHHHFDTMLYPESCSRIKGVPSYSRTPRSSTRVTSMFLHCLLTALKLRRG